MSEPTAELVVLDPKTGELLAVRTADTEQLAEWCTNVQDARDALAESEAMVSDELVRRCDQEAKWTLRVGDPQDRQWEIRTSSPTAGTTVYPTGVLECELAKAVEEEKITAEAASRACQRRLVVEFEAPWGADIEDLAEQLTGAVGIQILGVEVDVVAANPAVKGSLSGINALAKTPGGKEALDRVRVNQPTGRRKARVTLKTRETI